MIDVNDVRCPKCQGPVWDERPNKKNPKGPDFRCKDKTCLDEKGYKTSIWEKDLVKGAAPYKQHAVQPHPTGKQAFTAGAPLPYEQETGAPPAAAVSPVALNRLDNLLSVYRTCFDEAHGIAAKHFGKDESHEATAAMAATLLIAAKDMGLVR